MQSLKLVSVTRRADIDAANFEPIQIKSSAAIKLGLVRGWLHDIETLVTRIETTMSMCEKECPKGAK